MNIEEAREHFDDEPEVHRKLIQQYLDKTLSQSDRLEVFVLIEQCNAWYKMYRELVEKKNNETK